MKTKTLYRKVEIRTADDLPKLHERYIVYHKKDGIREFPLYPSKISRDLWIKNVDWYLHPAELELPEDDEGNHGTCDECVEHHLWKPKLKRNANCKWCDEWSFCHCINQLGDDCEGKCPGFEKGKYYKEEIDDGI